jgi:DNA-binding GntR family transcriptional regulator
MTNFIITESPKTREELVADKLRQAILVGHFKPGEKLDQGAISRQFSVSLSPVREAIRTLAAEDLVRMYPHRGVVVAELSISQLKELHEIRGMLEGAAAKKAVPHLTREKIAKLQTILDTADATAEGDTEKLQALNHEFHQTIYTACEQSETLKLILQLRNKVAPYIRLYLDAGLRETAWTAHRKIFEACKKGDAEKAELETRKHLAQVCEGILKSLE